MILMILSKGEYRLKKRERRRKSRILRVRFSEISRKSFEREEIQKGQHYHNVASRDGDCEAQQRKRGMFILFLELIWRLGLRVWC